MENPIRVCLKMLCTPKPNGFADHYPYEKWLFHWEYTQHFQTNLWKYIKIYIKIYQNGLAGYPASTIL